MLILSLHAGPHDSSAALFDDYRLLAAVAEERMNRVKGSGGFPEQSLAEVLRIAGVERRDVDVVVCTRGFFRRRYFTHWRPHERVREWLRRLADREKTREMNVVVGKLGRRADEVFDAGAFLADLGLRADARLFFSNHHFAHALPSLFFTDWDEALLYTADGSGDQVYYSHNLFQDGALTNLYGDDRWLGRAHPSASLGLAYGFVTEALGFRMNRHEGKLTGLAGYGEPTLLPEMQRHFSISQDGRIEMDLANDGALRDCFRALALGESRENAAASVQALLEWGIHGALHRLVERHRVRRLGLAGGVFANVRLNRLLAESLPVDEVFIVPPMGDDGLVIGGALQFLLDRDGLAGWLSERRRLDNVYWGGDHAGGLGRAVADSGEIGRCEGDPVALSADRLAAGQVGALYHGRMEYGPRALGARSILANPADARVNQILNERLQRSEFMPFAPVVGEADAAELFDIGPVNRYAARFMTICCAVNTAWRERIPAVVHVDGSARPQIIRQEDNPLYFDILAAFTARTGLPALVNTSFNVHEEPIVNRPEECLRALRDGRVDFVTTADGVWVRA
ncbi:MAG TPA: carbamoyltransferase C-terminal domain-containing protein [Stellaceae bacterium]|nr:carbamoyltransferase C-terminal domain-containing protein [Stellaceae bacterium]